MSRVFLYCRVSTAGQTTANQVQEAKGSGFDVEPHRIVEEVVSGAVPAQERKGFTKLLERMEQGDILVTTKLDRLGRNAMDVRSTVELMASRGIRVHCLALGGADLTSAAGKMMMSVISAMAEFERDLLVERTQAGLERAKAEGKQLGRPQVASAEDVGVMKAEGLSQAEAAKRLNVSLSTIKRLWNRAA